MEVYMIIAILYISLVFSTYADDSQKTKYTSMGVGSLCSGRWEQISRTGDCVRAAMALNLQFEAMWDGPGDFPGCLHANDGRDRVYFNISPMPSSVANNRNYTAICQKKYESYCYADDTNPYRRFGARTSYLVTENKDDTEVSIPGCKPVMLWHNVHHGTRGPTPGETAAINKTLPGIRQAILQAFDDGKSKLCKKDVNNLENWKLIYSAEEDRVLREAGRNEMKELGQRMGNRFPDLLKNSQKTVRKTSPEQRTHESMKAFLMGLYGHPVDFEDSTDNMFTFFENCHAWKDGVQSNNEAYIEMNKLMETPYYQEMVAEISNRIGVQLNKNEVKIAYIVCRYEIANYPDAISPWCALFSEGNLRLMEYADDLRYYYLDGYGTDISRQMTQPLVADLHQHFSSLRRGQENTSAFLYVVRSRAAHHMLLALNLYKDEPPLASDWPTPHTLWRTSSMLNFGHNLALVALKCDEPQDQFKVLAMHQERRISLSSICGEEICPLQSFLDNIESIVDLDFDKVCQYENQWSSWSTWSICSQTCGSATKSRTRTCPSGSTGEKQCLGKAEENIPCILPSCESYCYADDTNPYRRFGVRTSYLVTANLDDTEVSVPGCKPVMLWLNVHHGMRGPRRTEIDEMKKLLPAIRQAILQAFADGKSKLCEKDVYNLKNWKFIYSDEEDRLLGEAGRKEMRELGQRMGKRFPDLLKDSQKTVRKTSPEQRVHDSMKAFLMGMYGHQVDFVDSTEDMFTFSNKCRTAWLNGSSHIEKNKLKESQEYKQMVAEISRRIGVQLNETQVNTAYEVCRHEIGNYPDELSPWCALFSEGNLQLMEYTDDLRYYYLDGYGNDITRKMTQPLVADLHQHFSSLRMGQENTPAFLYVVHSRVAHHMLPSLGLYKDEEPPLASDWPSPHTLWRTSEMLNFGHNLALVALQCDDPQNQFKVLAMHQERRISLSGICGEEICRLQSFLDNIKSIVDLDLDKVCQSENQWSSWSGWSACSQTCGNATKSRTRTCSSGSEECPGLAEETISCILPPCEYCYADDSTPYRQFGPITSYLINANLDTTEISVPGCKPVMLWVPTRHGSRGPNFNDFELMMTTLPGIKQGILQAWEEGKSKLCHKDVMNLKNWRLIYSTDEEKFLGEAGRKEMKELGKRFGMRFPDLLMGSQKTVRKTSPEQRTHDSMDAFLIGLYGHQVDFENSTEDMFTFFEDCPAYEHEVVKNNSTYLEMNKLKDSEEYEKMLAEITDRIGVQLNKTQVDAAWRVCGFDIANYPDDVSPWCALFSEGDLRLLEYSYNLRNYYTYHHNITWQLTQPLMADLHQKLSSLKAGNQNTSAFLYMVHSPVAHALLVAFINVLGLYRNESPPLASDWPSPNTTEDVSTMFSFGHNLALVALQCDYPQDSLKVLAMHNERRISMDGICGEEICPLQIFLDKIQSIVDVDYDKVCEFKELS